MRMDAHVVLLLHLSMQRSQTALWDLLLRVESYMTTDLYMGTLTGGVAMAPRVADAKKEGVEVSHLRTKNRSQTDSQRSPSEL